MSAARTGAALLLSEKGPIGREPRCSPMVLSGPAAADWPSRVTERDDTRESEEINDGDRATQCPDQRLAAGDHGALERCQPLAGLVSGDDEDQHRRSFSRKRGQGRFQGEVGRHVHTDHRDGPRLPAGQAAASPKGGQVVGARSLELTPEGDGTLLTTTFDYALPGGVFGKIADALIV